MINTLPPSLPFKSVAGALLFTVVLGPIGLLYATFWGGLAMIIVGIAVMTSKLFFSMLIFWITCCVWAVAAVDSYNKKIMGMR